ncbi:MAG: hypothetical protein IJQ05_06030 [Bacteroidaceae bacterium]|nr:hypothetical protein [Bacteroidaceae bacterium]
MKKILFFLMLACVCVASSATDLWEGTHAVNWDNTVMISADKFADIRMGNKIVLEFTVQAEDVVELKSNGQKLPGTRYHRLYTDNTSIEVFLTKSAVEEVKANGLEICGSNFTLSKVWFGDGKDNVTDNTVWTGYFWMDNWSTLEIWKEFLPQSLDGYKAIRFCSEAGRTDYVINVMASWDGADKIADQTTMTMTDNYAELDLTKLTSEQKQLFYKTDRIMIQCNKEAGEPFNFTSIELVEIPSGISAMEGASKDKSAELYNLAGRKTDGNSRGIVISRGKKYIK